MPNLVLASRGLCGVFRASRFGTKFSYIAGRRWSSYEVVGERSQPGDDLQVKKVKEEMFVGNSCGLDLANLIHRLDTKLAALKEKITLHQAELELVDSSQEERIRYLLYSNDRYKHVRGRYLSTFKRVHFGITTKVDKEIIENSNQTVHWGDAIFDSSLYTEPNGRDDPEVFQKLYGVLPEDMEWIQHDKTIHILNTHAGILSSDSKKGSRKFANAFAKFIKLFEISGFDESYLDGKDTEVTHAYYAFVNCAASEMKHTMRPRRHS